MGKGSRTNIGYFNPSFDTKTVTFRAYTPAGVLIGQELRSIPAWSQVQQPAFALIPPSTAGNTVHADFYVTFEVQGGAFWSTRPSWTTRPTTASIRPLSRTAVTDRGEPANGKGPGRSSRPSPFRTVGREDIETHLPRNRRRTA